MEKLIKKLSKLLAIQFPGSEVELSKVSTAQRVSGSMIWKGFEGQAQIDRQVRLRQVIDAGLQPEERLAVSLILTLTPAEMVMMSEE